MGILDQTFGLLYIVASIGMIMYGITILQTFFYFVVYPDDPVRFKALVTSVWLLDTLDTALGKLVTHFNYYYLVSSFGHPENLQDGIWSFYLWVLVNFCISLLVKGFYVAQIYRLCNPPWKLLLPPFITILLLISFAFGIETDVFFVSKVKFALLAHLVKWRVIALATLNLASDAIIAAALCILLRNRRTDWPGSRANSIIHSLVVFCVERFLLFSILGVFQLVIYLTLPDSFYSFAFEIILAKLYANSLLATLNARRSMKRMGINVQYSTEITTTSYPLESTHPRRAIISSPQSGHGDDVSTETTGGFRLHTRDLQGKREI